MRIIYSNNENVIISIKDDCKMLKKIILLFMAVISLNKVFSEEIMSNKKLTAGLVMLLYGKGDVFVENAFMGGGVLNNLMEINFAENEGSFLVGALSALKAMENNNYKQAKINPQFPVYLKCLDN
jgi:basic membrane lipoprotein Med (substrate-binding protein (PBP1-ABC) superfamily)